jgi:hypothetical protein
MFGYKCGWSIIQLRLLTSHFQSIITSLCYGLSPRMLNCFNTLLSNNTCGQHRTHSSVVMGDIHSRNLHHEAVGHADLLKHWSSIKEVKMFQLSIVFGIVIIAFSSCFVSSEIHQQLFQVAKLLDQDTCILNGSLTQTDKVNFPAKCSNSCLHKGTNVCKMYSVNAGNDIVTCQTFTGVTQYGYNVPNCRSYQVQKRYYAFQLVFERSYNFYT